MYIMKNYTLNSENHLLLLVDYHGRELYRNESQQHPANPFVYFVGPFIPPKGFFFVRVNGEDEQVREGRGEEIPGEEGSIGILKTQKRMATQHIRPERTG